MTLVEDRYNQALDQMTGKERVERSLSLFSALYEMLTLQVKRDLGAVSDRKIQKKYLKYFICLIRTYMSYSRGSVDRYKDGHKSRHDVKTMLKHKCESRISTLLY